MITENDLKEAIAECEGQRNPTSGTCMKLAAFYTIKDKMYPDNEPVYYSRSAGHEKDFGEKHTYISDTEFGKMIAGMDVVDLLSIMDELMDTLKVVSPRIYDGVMRKLKK